MAAAQSEAKLDVLKVRYGGAQLDSASFASLQQELAAEVETSMSSYDQALELSLTSLHMQYSSGAIDQNEFDRQSQQLIAGYEAKVNDLRVRVESFQMETIADAFGQSLDGILPNIQGTTAEKLTEAMNLALEEKPDAALWTQADIVSWFGLEGLGTETQTALSGLLQSAALTIPENMKSSIVSSVESMDYSDIDFIGPCADAASEQISEKFNEIEYSEVGASVSSGVGEAIQNADRTEIDSAITSLKESTDASVNAAFSAGVSTTMPVNITLDYNILNPTQTITASGNGVSGSTSVSVSAGVQKNAAGGFVSGGPMLSWLAEEGYGEFIIPTNPSRRMRALELYEQAGKALGVDTNADGGFAGGRTGLYTGASNNSGDIYAPVAADSGKNDAAPQSVQINVQMAPEIVIQSGNGQDAEGIADVIRRHIREMADELGGEIASQLEGVFSNMPLQKA